MKPQLTLTDAQATALLSLHPWAQRHGERAVAVALDALLTAEQGRRGEPDPRTGAAPVAALLQGSLLQAEFDPSLHLEGWRLGAVVADVREMMRHNARLGFARGDALLAAVAGALRAALPTARVVRLHGDAFAALLPPSSGVALEEAHATQARAALGAALAPFAREGEVPAPVEVTVALLDLTVTQPAHWQVLGPLVWSELERALLLERLERARGLQTRRLELGGAVPGEPTATVGRGSAPTPRG